MNILFYPKHLLRSLHIALISIVLSSTLFSACSTDITDTKEIISTTKEPISTISLDATIAPTRAGFTSINVPEGTEPVNFTTHSDFRAYIFILSSQGRKAWFELKVKNMKMQNGKVVFKEKLDNIALHWIESKGASTDLVPNSNETWKMCAVGGGGDIDANNHVVFNEGKHLQNNQMKVAFYCGWHTLKVHGKNKVSTQLQFEHLGAFLKVAVTAHQSLRGKYNRNYTVQTNTISPNGYFDFSKNSPIWSSTKQQPKWHSTQQGDYKVHYQGTKQNLSKNHRKDLFLLWGMPYLDKNEQPFITIYNNDANIMVSRLGQYTPFTSSVNIAAPNNQGKTHYLTAQALRLHEALGVAYPIPLARAAKRNVSRDMRIFAKNNYCGDYDSGYFTWKEAKTDACPQGWHLPTYEEWVAAFPYCTDKDIFWDNIDYCGWRNETLRMGTEGNKHAIDADFIQGQCKSQYISVGNGGRTLYAIRFADFQYHNNLNTPYRNLFKCAYRYEALDYNLPTARIRVTARYIGNALTSIKDVANNTYWRTLLPTDVVREFPLSGRFFKQRRWGKLDSHIMDQGTQGYYWTSSAYNRLGLKYHYYPITNDRVQHRRQIRKDEWLTVRPFINVPPTVYIKR